MRIFLSGLMGAGKTTVARALATRTGLPLFDVDELIGAQIGGSISDFFRQSGESAFRKLEEETIRKLVSHEAAGVFALGHLMR